MGTARASDFREQVLRLVQRTAVDDGPSSLTDADIEEFVQEAVNEHSRQRGRLVTDTTLDGDGSAHAFRVDNLAVAFEEEFSRLVSVEHPTGENPPELIDPNEYTIRRNTSGNLTVYFLDAPDSGTNNIRLEYTVRHTLSDATNTLADADFYAVCHLAAAYALEALANRAAHRVDSSFAGSEVGPGSHAQVYRTNARAERVAYFAHFGQTERSFGQPAPATVTTERDLSLIHGADRLFHRGRWL